MEGFVSLDSAGLGRVVVLRLVVLELDKSGMVLYLF